MKEQHIYEKFAQDAEILSEGHRRYIFNKGFVFEKTQLPGYKPYFRVLITDDAFYTQIADYLLLDLLMKAEKLDGLREKFRNYLKAKTMKEKSAALK